ncbi:MAG: GlsB/YeaQ/YmgE family stress response membrane protein [Acidimicrobiales bacterium]|nr:GlsB/YeaQ/YmgE family stress response membrane protein [Acidimicrobiales bacterium]
MNIFGWIAVGLIAGSLASAVTREERRGCLYTLVIGVLGGLLGGAITQAALGDGLGDFSWRSLLIAFLGACLLLLVLQAIGGRRGRTGRRPQRR